MNIIGECPVHAAASGPATNGDKPVNMFGNRLRACLRLGAAAGLTFLAGSASAEWALNMTPGVTPMSRDVYDLHMLILWVCVVIGVLVFGAMIWSIVHHRRSRGAEAAQFHHSTAAELLWTGVPFFILVGMAIPATQTLIAMEDTTAPDLTIKVTGYQWKWRYDYLEDDVSFYSNLANSSRRAMHADPRAAENYLLEVDNPVVVPVGRKIRFLLTSDDVIHAWWVPALGMKKDAIPGFVNEIWARIDEDKVGIYRGQCAELCGKDHGFMPIVVDARSDADYRAWVAENTNAPAAMPVAMTTAAAIEATAAVAELSEADLLAQGETVYGTACSSCHQANGQGVPGAFPAITASAVATGPVADHIGIVLNGKSGTAMMPFGAQLSDTDIAAVITFQRNALGNSTGDIVQPADIAASR